MRFAIFHAVCALWVLWRFWLPMNAPRAVKVAGFVVTLLIAAFPAVTATFFGGLVSPELPAWVLAAGNGCVFALTVLAGLTLLREVVICPFWPAVRESACIASCRRTGAWRSA